jgi:predicted small metal-binding protein
MAITESEPHGNQKLNFRCSDDGPKNCDWQVSGNSEEEIMPKIEQHGRS